MVDPAKKMEQNWTNKKEPTVSVTDWAVYHTKYWGEAGWSTLFQCEQLTKALLIEWIKELPNVLPCKGCVYHYNRYQKRYPPTVDQLSVWLYYLRQSIATRLFHKRWKRAQTTVEKMQLLAERGKRRYSFAETMQWYKERSAADKRSDVLKFCHFVILTYPNWNPVTNTPVAQERRRAIQFFLCTILPRLVPSAKWSKECRDPRTWVNRYSLLWTFYWTMMSDSSSAEERMNTAHERYMKISIAECDCATTS